MITGDKCFTGDVKLIKSLSTNMDRITIFARDCAVNFPIVVIANFLFLLRPVREWHWKTLCLGSLFLCADELYDFRIKCIRILPRSIPLARSSPGAPLTWEVPFFNVSLRDYELLQTEVCIRTILICVTSFHFRLEIIQLITRIESCSLCQQKGELVQHNFIFNNLI